MNPNWVKDPGRAPPSVADTRREEDVLDGLSFFETEEQLERLVFERWPEPVRWRGVLATTQQFTGRIVL